MRLLVAGYREVSLQNRAFHRSARREPNTSVVSGNDIIATERSKARRCDWDRERSVSSTETGSQLRRTHLITEFTPLAAISAKAPLAAGQLLHDDTNAVNFGQARPRLRMNAFESDAGARRRDHSLLLARESLRPRFARRTWKAQRHARSPRTATPPFTQDIIVL